jgi:aminoglycoside phosphotransferase (APT) family kinase protein
MRMTTMRVLGHMPEPEREHLIRPLLDYLASGDHQADGQWQDWRIARITGGQNNLLHRASGPLGDLVIKFTMRDWRDRAGREYNALSALHQAGLAIAPKPVLLDRHRYAQPVVVQTWLEGEVSAVPPTTEAEWRRLLQHFAAIYTVTPKTTGVKLQVAVLNADSVASCKRIVRRELARIPRKARPAPLCALVHRFEKCRFPDCSDAPASLCRADNNILNVIRRPGLWASVDWEYSGWGSPAFEMANLITHPAYVDVPSSQWDRAIETYCEMVKDSSTAAHIRTYWKMLLIWWVARFARYLYEVPRGLDKRLVTRPSDWQADVQAKYEHYLDWAETLYRGK